MSDVPQKQRCSNCKCWRELPDFIGQCKKICKFKKNTEEVFKSNLSTYQINFNLHT